jgi:hypothetical protein
MTLVQSFSTRVSFRGSLVSFSLSWVFIRNKNSSNLLLVQQVKLVLKTVISQ